MHPGHGRHRPGRTVGGHRNLFHLGQRGDPPALGDPAGVLDVRHDHVHRSPGHVFPESLPSEERLSPGYGLSRQAGDLAEDVHLVARHRLLEPEQVQRFHLFGHLERQRPVEAAVAVHQQFHSVANPLPRFGQSFHPLVRVGLHPGMVGIPPVHLVERRRLHGGETGVHRPHGRVGKPLGRAVPGPPIQIGVHPHLLSPLPPQQSPDRHLQRLAGDIPQRLIHTADRRRPHPAAASREDIARARHLLPDHLHLGRIHSPQPFRHLLQYGDHQAVVAALARFPDPLDAGVGLHLDEYPVPLWRGVHLVNLQIRYLHSSSLDSIVKSPLKRSRLLRMEYRSSS